MVSYQLGRASTFRPEYNFNPELFYVGRSYSYTLSGVYVILVKPTYDEVSKENIQFYQSALDKAYSEAITDESMTDMQKARALHDYLAQHVEYDSTVNNEANGDKDSFNAFGALVKKKGSLLGVQFGVWCVA